MSQVIAMMGPIGAGKTSQNKRLAARFNLDSFSTGQLIREDRDPDAIRSHNKGEAAPTDYVQQLVLAHFAAVPTDKNIVFDGPILVEEAEAYQQKLPEMGHRLAVVVFLQVDEDEAERRIAARKDTHGRLDDDPEMIRKRWRRYQEQTLPVVEFYRTAGVPVVPVDGIGTPDEVAERVAAVAKEYGVV